LNCYPKLGSFGQVNCWQGICLDKAGQILVALKRNDEYALHIKGGAGLMEFRAI